VAKPKTKKLYSVLAKWGQEWELKNPSPSLYTNDAPRDQGKKVVVLNTLPTGALG